MKDIENNPESAQAIIESEIKRVNKAIKNVEKQIEKYTNEIKNNKMNYNTTSWNGWGYDI